MAVLFFFWLTVAVLENDLYVNIAGIFRFLLRISLLIKVTLDHKPPPLIAYGLILSDTNHWIELTLN